MKIIVKTFFSLKKKLYSTEYLLNVIKYLSTFKYGHFKFKKTKI